MIKLSQLSEKHVTKVNDNVITQNKKHCVNYKEKVHDKLTILGLSMLANTISIIDRYECICSDHQTWKVRKIRNNDNSNWLKSFCTPDFNVINTIRLMDTSMEYVKQLGCTYM